KPIQPDELWAALRRWVRPRASTAVKVDASATAPVAASTPPAASMLTPAPDLETLSALCQQLAALLADDDSAAAELLAGEEERLRAGLGAGYAPLAGAIANYDFETALTRLRNAAAAVGIAAELGGRA